MKQPKTIVHTSMAGNVNKDWADFEIVLVATDSFGQVWYKGGHFSNTDKLAEAPWKLDKAFVQSEDT